MRLDKCIADHSAYSRKEVKELLRRGSVRVNGAPEQDPGRQVDPEGDEIMLAGVILPTALHRTYMLNKPKGCISSTRTGKTKTVVEFLPPELRKGIFPAGRLDVDTEGMLLLTNDGDLAHRILSPRRHIPKYYLVQLAKPIVEKTVETFENGVVLEDGTRCLPARVAALPGVENTVLVELHEGKFHQVKRMFAAVENHVEQLLRVQMGGLPIDVKLGKGDYLLLLHKDIEQLFKTPDFSEVLRFCACFFCSYWINE